LADALGNLIDFRLLPGQAHDLRGTAALLEGLTCGQFLADRAFDANWAREALEGAKIEAVIPPKSNRRFPADFDRDTYKWRHLIDLRRETDPPHLCKAQGIQRDRHALLQDRQQLLCLHCNCCDSHAPPVNINRP